MTGVNGDYYLDTLSGDVYHKESGVWVFIENIKGTAGANGAQGIQGIQGVQGNPGVDGDDGAPGPNIVTTTTTTNLTGLLKGDGANVGASNLSESDLTDAVSKKHANTLDHAQNSDTDLDATFEATFEKNANKGAVSGYAGLDASQKVPTANLGGSGAGSTNYLRGDQTWVVPPMPLLQYRRTGSTRERWFTLQTTCTAMTVSTALTADRIYAHPFLVPKAITLDKIAVNCTTLVAGGGLRLGIYSDSNGEPGALVLDAGTIDSSGTGVKTKDINQTLTPGLYWLAAASKSATHAFRVPAIAATINVFGVASTLPTGVGTHFYAAHAYGALPDPFPSPTEGTSLVYPAVFVRLSA